MLEKPTENRPKHAHHRLLFAGVLCVLTITSAARADDQLSQNEIAATVQPVAKAVEATVERQAKLPLPRNDSEKLARMGEMDQAPRRALSKVDFAKYSEPQKRQIWTAISAVMQPIDYSNQNALVAMAPQDGWFAVSRYGQRAAEAAFLIVQHRGPVLWRRFLPAIETMAKEGEAKGSQYALMYDRLALSEGRPQRYGSQMQCHQGQYEPQQPMEDLATVDARRIALGMNTYAEYLQMFSNDHC